MGDVGIAMSPDANAQYWNVAKIPFCEKNYGVTFPMFAKIDVKGANAHQLFQYLTQAKPGILGTEAIKWNFTKFLIDRDGAPVARFAPQVAPADLEKPIEKYLSS